MPPMMSRRSRKLRGNIDPTSKFEESDIPNKDILVDLLSTSEDGSVPLLNFLENTHNIFGNYKNLVKNLEDLQKKVQEIQKGDLKNEENTQILQKNTILSYFPILKEVTEPETTRERIAEEFVQEEIEEEYNIDQKLLENLEQMKQLSLQVKQLVKK